MLKKLPSLRDKFTEVTNAELKEKIEELKEEVKPKRSSKKKQGNE